MFKTMTYVVPILKQIIAIKYLNFLEPIQTLSFPLLQKYKNISIWLDYKKVNKLYMYASFFFYETFQKC